MAETRVWNDRYGGKYPDPETVCKGPCDGMGCFPVYKNATKPAHIVLWEKAEYKKSSKDGWHFVKCPDCSGTGKIAPESE